jgi:hypothetical protein
VKPVCAKPKLIVIKPNFYELKCPTTHALYNLTYANFIGFKYFKLNNTFQSIDPMVSVIRYKQRGLWDLVVKNTNNRLLLQVREPAAWSALNNLLQHFGNFEYNIYKRRWRDLDQMTTLEKLLNLFFETQPKVLNAMVLLENNRLNYFEDDCHLLPFNTNLRPSDAVVEGKPSYIYDASSAIDPQVREKMIQHRKIYFNESESYCKNR